MVNNAGDARARRPSVGDASSSGNTADEPSGRATNSGPAVPLQRSSSNPNNSRDQQPQQAKPQEHQRGGVASTPATPVATAADILHTHRRVQSAQPTTGNGVAGSGVGNPNATNGSGDVPKVKILRGKNDEEVVAKRRGRFKILKDAAVTVIAPGEVADAKTAGADVAASAADTCPGAAMTAAPAPAPAPAPAAAPNTNTMDTSAEKLSPNKALAPSPNRSKSDPGSAHISGGGGGGRAVAASTVASASTAAPTSASEERAQNSSSASSSPMHTVQTIAPSASSSPSIQQPQLGASPGSAAAVLGTGANVPKKQKGRFSITPASAGMPLEAGGGESSLGPGNNAAKGGIGGARPPQHTQQPQLLPPKHQASQDSDSAPDGPSTREKEDRPQQRSPKHGQNVAATNAQQQQQQIQQPPGVKRQSTTQQQPAEGAQLVREHPAQPAGLFPEKHARAAVSDKASSAGRAGAQGTGLGKVFYFIDQMKLEVTEADKTIKGLQTDIKFLREKNKELERKYNEEKILRESTEAKAKALKKKLRDLKEMLPGALSEGTKPKKTDGGVAGDEKSSKQQGLASEATNAASEVPQKAQSSQRAIRRAPRATSMSPKRDIEERAPPLHGHPPKITDPLKPNTNTSLVAPKSRGQAAASKDSNVSGQSKHTRGSESSNAGKGTASTQTDRKMGMSEVQADGGRKGDQAGMVVGQQASDSTAQPQPPHLRLPNINYDSDGGNAARSAANAGPGALHLRASSVGTVDAMTLPMKGATAAAPPPPAPVNFDPLGTPSEQVTGMGAQQHMQLQAQTQGQAPLPLSGTMGGQQPSTSNMGGGVAQASYQANTNLGNMMQASHQRQQQQQQPPQQYSYAPVQHSWAQQQTMGGHHQTMGGGQHQTMGGGQQQTQQAVPAPQHHHQSQQYQQAPMPQYQVQMQQSMQDEHYHQQQQQQQHQHQHQHQQQAFYSQQTAVQGFQGQNHANAWNSQGPP